MNIQTVPADADDKRCAQIVRAGIKELISSGGIEVAAGVKFSTRVERGSMMYSVCVTVKNWPAGTMWKPSPRDPSSVVISDVLRAVGEKICALGADWSQYNRQMRFLHLYTEDGVLVATA